MKRDKFNSDWQEPSMAPRRPAGLRASEGTSGLSNASSLFPTFVRLALLGVAAIALSGCHLFDYQSGTTPSPSTPDAVAAEYP